MRIGVCVLCLLAWGCRPRGLPDEPAGAAASDPEAPAVRFVPPPAIDRSAFEGTELPRGGPHDHHGHGGAERKPEPRDDASDEHDHGGGP